MNHEEYEARESHRKLHETERCPFWEICVTPHWYPKSHSDFVDEVCMENWKHCIRILSGDFISMETGKPIVKDSPEWNRIKNAIQSRKKEMEDLESVFSHAEN